MENNNSISEKSTQALWWHIEAIELVSKERRLTAEEKQLLSLCIDELRKRQ